MKRLKKYLLPAFLLLLTHCKKDEKLNNGIVPKDFLSDKNYEELIIEVQYMDGYQPSNAALENLKSLLKERINKPGGISIVQNNIAASGKGTYSLSDIKSIESEKRTKNVKGKTLTAYFLFLDGEYAANSGSSKILGIAYGATSMVIFEKTIKEFSGGLGQPSLSTLETTVINHEFGHILGLVNNGTSMQNKHQDQPNGKHCNSSNCLMYHAAETSDIINNLIGGAPSLDSQCIDDLKANGGK